MATYTIVDPTTDPLGPGEIHSDQTILVSNGDVFILSPSATGTTEFVSASGLPTDFDIQINDSNANGAKIVAHESLTPTIEVADNVDAETLDIDAKTADALVMNVGDNASLGKFDGPEDGPSNVTIGDGFSTTENWTFGDAGNTIDIGDNATFENIDTGDGADSITFGEFANVDDLKTEGGNDTVTFGDDSTIHSAKLGEGDDQIYYGNRAQADETDGEDGNDTYTTQTAEPHNDKNFEQKNVVCFVRGSRIDTRKGATKVEDLRIGDLVRTADHGFQPIRWIASTRVDQATLACADHLRPMRIIAGCFGRGCPVRDLFVSPQHRILIDSPIVKRMFGSHQALVAAKKLVDHPGIEVATTFESVEYFHILFQHHEIIFSENLACESLLLGPEAAKTLGPQTVAQINRALPIANASGPTRPVLTDRQHIKALVRRHVANQKPFQIRHKSAPALALAE